MVSKTLTTAAAVIVVLLACAVVPTAATGGGGLRLQADFSANTTLGALPLAVQFTDLSPAGVNNWTWNFGDGSISYEQHPVHVYERAGMFTVNLFVRNATGAGKATKWRYISVTDPNVLRANFTADVTRGPAPLSVQFTDTSVGAPSNWSWCFGDGTNSSEQNPVHIYEKAGWYTVVLKIVRDDRTDVKVQSKYITVTDPNRPVANYTANRTSGRAPLAVQFTDTSTGTIAEWKWYFGDGAYSTDQNPVHVYTRAGTYPVRLRVKGANATVWAEKSGCITVLPMPKPTFTTNVTSGKAPLAVQFTDTTTELGAKTYLWSFGDRQTSTEQNPVHVFSKVGTYRVTLKIETEDGVVVSIPKYIRVTGTRHRT
jgi:PKD repeat protein